MSATEPKGFLKVYRKLFYSEFWTETREFSRAEAWLDLLNIAEYVRSSKFVRGKRIEVEVGEVIASGRYLAERWHWSHKKVRNFLDTLEEACQITQRRAQGENIITIVRYALYNSSKEFGGTPRAEIGQKMGTPKGTDGAHREKGANTDKCDTSDHLQDSEWHTEGTPKGTDGAHRGHKIREEENNNPIDNIEGFSLEQVLRIASSPDVALSEADAREFYDHYASQNWFKSSGVRLTHLAPALRTWKRNRGNFDAPRGKQGNNGEPTIDDLKKAFAKKTNYFDVMRDPTSEEIKVMKSRTIDEFKAALKATTENFNDIVERCQRTKK